jgi:sterol desaturase/sphingolipid hydroxylase (fatty acid hydroxylase superfamily)
MQLVAVFAIVGTYAGLCVVERSPLHRLLGGMPWLVIAAAGFAIVPPWVAAHAGSPLALTDRVGIVPSGLAGFVLADLTGYLTHRARHTLPMLWRWHQLHHSAERVDVAGAAFLHPIDLAIELAGVIAAAIALGLSPDATVVAAFATWLATMFQHLRASTPPWLGRIIQRPEAHAVHHARGVHAYNYGKLMIWDIALGTFRDPAQFAAGPAGFWDGASGELAVMLAGRDVGDSRKDER